jgi:hypothetical protein
MKAALILQACIEVCFFSLVATLEHRCRNAGSFPRHTRPVFYVLYVTSFMMLVRCVVRAVDGFEAASCPRDTYCGVVSTHEWFLWLFEVANITLFVMLLAIFHPGKYLPPSSKIYLDPLDKTSWRVGPGFSKADKRPFWLTVLDPFGFFGILSGKGYQLYKFWEEQNPLYPSSDSKRQPKGDRGSVGEMGVSPK